MGVQYSSCEEEGRVGGNYYFRGNGGEEKSFFIPHVDK